MRLFKKGKKIDVEQRIRDVGNAYRIQHPECVLGFAGYFLQPKPDIYISDQIEEYLTEDPSFTMDLLEVYRQYDSDDFGKLSKLGGYPVSMFLERDQYPPGGNWLPNDRLPR
ncbi:MAG: hypothetical protein IJK01_06750 [Clostridia bacterium]|nr:hypothetical protein [Clostridia bacterium]